MTVIASPRAPLRILGAALATVLLAACGSSGGGAVTVPSVGAARVFKLGAFTPAGTVQAGTPVTLAFNVQEPDGKTLTQYKSGPGPHTGIHLIIVRRDLAYIVHKHPPVTPSGRFTQVVTFPAPGPYRVLVDIYPNIPGGEPNFQLFTNINVAGHYVPQKLPGYKPNLDVDGYHFAMVPAADPHVHAIQARFLHINVTDPNGKPTQFVPWFGALAHAIFFRQGSLDYFHTHICAPNAPNCGSLPGVAASRVTGHATPGKLTVGVLLPIAGTWRLFLQLRQGSRILTAPYTLKVS
jgi:hypothetical protein